jgi:hypothetical protein
MRGKAHHRHAFRRAAEDQRSWAGDSRYTLGETWCKDRADGSLFTADEMTAEARLDADCPKCSAAMGKAMLAKYGDRVRVVPIEAHKESEDYSIRYSRSAYEFHLDGVLRGYIIAEAGFGKGWRLCRVAGALDFAKTDDRVTGDSISGRKPERYGSHKPGAGAPFRIVHFASRDAMACAAVKAAERGDLPTVAEQAERKAAGDAKRAEEAAQRERDRAAAAQRREEAERVRAERMTEAREGLASLWRRDDLTNLERAGVASAAGLLGFTLAEPATD